MKTNLKIIALVTMVIDHIGYILFPQYEWLRIIGRLSLPIFCYFIAEGFIYTKNYRKYLLTIAITSIFVQLEFFIMNRPDLNILFGFIIALISLKLKIKYGRIAYLLLLLMPLLNVEYGIYSALLILIFHEFKENKLKVFIFSLLITTLYSISINSDIQIFSIGSLLIIWYLKESKFKLNKYVFYVAYPIQWLLLIMVKIIIDYV